VVPGLSVVHAVPSAATDDVPTTRPAGVSNTVTGPPTGAVTPAPCRMPTSSAKIRHGASAAPRRPAAPEVTPASTSRLAVPDGLPAPAVSASDTLPVGALALPNPSGAAGPSNDAIGVSALPTTSSST